MFCSPNVRPAKSTHSEVQVQVQAAADSRETSPIKHYCEMIIISGTEELRKSIAKLHQDGDVLPDEEQIIVGTGSKELIFLLMNIFNGGMYICSISVGAHDISIFFVL